jgi:hypothetical protein
MSKRHAGIRCRTAAGPAGRALASAAFCPPRRLRRPRSAISPRSPWLGAPKTRWPLYGARGCPPPQGDMRPSPPFQGGSGSHVRLSEPHSSNRRSADTCLEKRAPLPPVQRGSDSHASWDSTLPASVTTPPSGPHGDCRSCRFSPARAAAAPQETRLASTLLLSGPPCSGAPSQALQRPWRQLGRGVKTGWAFPRHLLHAYFPLPGFRAFRPSIGMSKCPHCRRRAP